MKSARVLLLVFLFSSIWGISSDLLAQNTNTPDVVRDVIAEVELGIRVNGGVQFRRRNLRPLQEQSLDFLTQAVSGELSHSVRYYGVGVALRGYGATLAFTGRFGNGVQAVHWVPFEDGRRAIPYEPNYQEWSLRAQYFVTNWIGGGLSYRWKRDNLDQSSETPINGERVASALFGVRSRRALMSLYVPVQKEWGRVRVFGRIGSSVFGRTNETYNTFFVRHQSPENPERNLNPDQVDAPIRFDGDQQSMNVQFARVGGEVPVWGTSLRGSFGVERLSVPDWTTTWSYDVQLEIGLPF